MSVFPGVARQPRRIGQHQQRGAQIRLLHDQAHRNGQQQHGGHEIKRAKLALAIMGVRTSGMLMVVKLMPTSANSPEVQGEGHGRRLMRRLMDLARWHGAERIFLEVRPSNPRAMQLYHTLGFNEIGRRPKYYPAKNGREDAIVMALELLPPGSE